MTCDSGETLLDGTPRQMWPNLDACLAEKYVIHFLILFVNSCFFSTFTNSQWGVVCYKATSQSPFYQVYLNASLIDPKCDENDEMVRVFDRDIANISNIYF